MLCDTRINHGFKFFFWFNAFSFSIIWKLALALEKQYAHIYFVSSVLVIYITSSQFLCLCINYGLKLNLICKLHKYRLKLNVISFGFFFTIFFVKIGLELLKLHNPSVQRFLKKFADICNQNCIMWTMNTPNFNTKIYCWILAKMT